MKAWGQTKERIEKFKKYSFETLSIHAGQEPDPMTGSVMAPMHLTSTYAQKAAGQPIGEYEYSRTHNPTRRVLEDALALLEGGTYGLCTSSGMSAIQLILSLVKLGDEIVCCDDVYGGTYRLMTKILEPMGHKIRFVDLSDAKNWDSIGPKTRWVWVESPTNPLLKIMDIQKISDKAHKVGARVVVDNTFMSPYFQRPLELGADIVMHSVTKYINGHSDIVSGAVICRDDELAEKLYFNQNSMGLVMPPFDAWLVTRSLKTLPIRMKAHQENAWALAKWLEQHPKIEKVIYPGLESHPQHALAKEQMSGFGGMLSFYVKGGLEEAEKVLKQVKVFTLAESLGGVESLIEHPAIMTHASVPLEIREANGITDNFLRASVGLESLNDLKKDLEDALSQI